MKAQKENRVITIDERKKDRYIADGYTILDDKGKVIERPVGAADQEAVEAAQKEIAALKAENAALKEQLAALGAADQAAEKDEEKAAEKKPAAKAK